MDDRELAQQLVEHLDEGEFVSTDRGSIVMDWPVEGRWMGVTKFVRDWRVAGACLSAWPTTINVEHLQLTLDQMLRCPVAICEAFVHAMKQTVEDSSNG